MSTRKTIAVSGGFDPVHIGHVRMIQAAAEHGDVWVIINSDPWLIRKKGYIFKPTAFANGGDRKTDNTPEMDVCDQLGIELLWNIGGGKIQSSSELVQKAEPAKS